MIELSDAGPGLYRRSFAGDTFNTAWYLRALLPASEGVEYFTALGDDLYSAEMLRFMQENGIGTRHIQRIAGKCPGLYLIHQEAGDRHFTYWRNTAAARQLADDKQALSGAVQASSWAYISGITLAILEPGKREELLSILREARNNGTRIAFDPNLRPRLWASQAEMKAAVTAAARISHLVLPTYPDEKAAFGDHSVEHTAQRYRDLGCEEIVIKNGAAPVLVMTRHASHQIPAQENVAVVDPTGAGDSFNAAYMAARFRGKDGAESARAGHAMAALVVGHKGALVDRSLLPAG